MQEVDHAFVKEVDLLKAAREFLDPSPIDTIFMTQEEFDACKSWGAEED